LKSKLLSAPISKAILDVLQLQQRIIADTIKERVLQKGDPFLPK
jgi:hypothetical protein